MAAILVPLAASGQRDERIIPADSPAVSRVACHLAAAFELTILAILAICRIAGPPSDLDDHARSPIADITFPDPLLTK
jgi:hypothetical protein